MKNKRINVKSEAGFTLMELIVVIAIIAILIGLLLPQFSGMTDKANAVSAKSDAKSALTALTSYATSVANNPSVVFTNANANKKMVKALGLSATEFDSATNGLSGTPGYFLVELTNMVKGGTIARLRITKGGLEFTSTLDTLKGKITDTTCYGDADRCNDLVDEGIVNQYSATRP